MTSTLFTQATHLRAALNHLYHGATHEQRVTAARALYRLDDDARWPQDLRQCGMYVGNANLAASPDGVRYWLNDQLDRQLYYGASVILRQRGPANDREAAALMAAIQQCIDALTAAGAVAPESDPLQEAFRACGGSVSYV